MIAHLKGKITEKFGNSLIIDVNGVGYEVTVPTPDFEAVHLDEERKFYTYHAVRENAEDLYGFSTLAAKKIAIANADAAFIAKASGVGKKSAERVIVDLRDKVGIPSHYGATEAKFKKADEPDEALDALIALGFPLKEATAALEKVATDLPVEERVRLALKNS